MDLEEGCPDTLRLFGKVVRCGRPLFDPTEYSDKFIYLGRCKYHHSRELQKIKSEERGEWKRRLIIYEDFVKLPPVTLPNGEWGSDED